MNTRMVLFVILGTSLLGTILLKRVTKRVPVLLPILYVALGYLVFHIPIYLEVIDPIQEQADGKLVEYLTEFAVIVSLLAAGLTIDRPFSFRKDDGWLQVWPLLAITMPLTIIALTLLGQGFLGMSLGSALLLGAALSPTDPVLAKSVQVGPPGESERDDVRFDLTVEAGFNDGLAFPFTYLAIAVAAMSTTGETFAEVIGKWLALDVLWRCAAGVAIGFLVGRITAAIVFRGERESEDAPIHMTMGVVVFGTLFAAYGLAEILEGYGFLAVFIGAVTIRQYEPHLEYPKHAHRFVHQVEQIVLVMLLFGLGSLIASGMMDELTWTGAAIGLLAVLVIRPITGYIALVGPLSFGIPQLGRCIIAFAGIRGLGTLYYLSYATNKGEFDHIEEAWAVCLFTILVSILVHGLGVPILMKQAESNNALAASNESFKDRN